ncbi:MAG: tripartite tricarboxylate transporter substrate binding protein [Pseudomonadota bacterium]|jgi:tripartite-type tricarboxylate transporter receptor subunit TctC
MSPCIRLAAGLVALAAALPAAAQKYPEKPIRMVLPFAPGGGTDVLGRIIGARLGESLGAQFIIENRSGAGGTIGTEVVARANPDGYTLLFTSASHSFNPALYSKLGYDALRDFAPITLVAMVPNLLVVHPSLPAKNVQDLIKLARAKPGQLFYASAGAGSSVHLAAALFVAMAKVDMTAVHYKSGGLAMTGILSGEASLVFATMQSAMPLVRAGKLRPIAISTAQRSPALPNVPSIAESGVKGYDASGWYGMLAPAGVRTEIVERLQGEVARMLGQSELKERLASEGAVAVASTPAQFDRFIREEIARWTKVVRELGLKLD